MFYAAALTNTTLGISHGRLLVGLSIVNFPSNVTSFDCKEESVNVFAYYFFFITIYLLYSTVVSRNKIPWLYVSLFTKLVTQVCE